MAELPTNDAAGSGQGDGEAPVTVTITGDGWLQAVAPSFLALIGRPIEALAGLNLLDLVHPLDAARARRLLSEVDGSGTSQSMSLRLFVAGEQWSERRVSARGVGDGRLVLDIDVATQPHSQPTARSQPSPEPAGDAQPSPEPVRAPLSQSLDDERSGYVALLPGPEVPMQRAAIRASVGGGSTPMLEIDPAGRTTFVSGDWKSLAGDDRSGVDVFEALLDGTARSAQIAEALGGVLDEGRPGRVEVEIAGSGTRWVQVLPIPSPHVARTPHALIAVTARPELAPIDVKPVEPPPVVSTTPVPPSAIEALARVTSATSATVSSGPAEADVTVETPAPPETESQTQTQTGAVPTERVDLRAMLVERSKPIRNWVRGRGLSWPQVAAACGVALIALLLRTWDLAELPTGFHGDEAITGQEAQRVLDDGSIGVYTGSALGQPTAPFYIHAIGVGLFGNTIWATRIISALAGVLTVVAAYLIVQRRFDHRTAIASSLAVATMTWTIHFSRIAYGVAWWPLAVLLAIAAIDRAATNSTARTWLIAGGASIFGVYVYNSHWIFGLAVVLFVIPWLGRRLLANDRTGLWAGVGLLGALIVGWPMISFARDDRNGFFNHFDLVSRRSSDEWTDASFAGKTRLFVDWYFEAWDTLLFSPVSDGADAAGIIKQVPLVFTVLAAVGVITVLRRHRTAFGAMLLTTIAVTPIVPALTFDAATRRDYGMAACLAILAGIGAIEIITQFADRVSVKASQYAIAGLGAAVLFTSIIPYFTTFKSSEGQRWVFAEELITTVDAVKLAQQDGPVFVNWFSGRHYWDYPTLDYLLDTTPGANRTPVDRGYIENPPLELTDGIDQDQLYVFIGAYADNLDRLKEMYPEGRVIAEQAFAPRVVAYEVPAGP